MAKFNRAVDMTQGNPYKLYAIYAIPLLVGNILQQLYNIVDTVVVGNALGKTSLAAVGSGFPLVFLLTAVFIGLGLGSMIVVSQLAGQNDRENLQKLLGTMYRLVLMAAIPLTLVGVLIAGPILQVLQVQEAETLRQATLYLQVVFLGLLGTFGFNLNAGFLMGIGDSMSSLLFLTLATGLNIVLDLVLTLVIPLGILGVAIATSFAQTFSWVFGIFYINRKYDYLHINLLKLPFDRALLKRSLTLGAPGAIQQFFYALGSMFVQALVNRNGEVFTAGFTAANKVDTFVFLPILTLSMAMTTYIGQNVGKRDVKRIHQGIRSGFVIMVGVSLLFACLVYIVRRYSIQIFNQEEGVIEAGLYYLEQVLPFYAILGVFYGLNAVFQGVGETIVPMVSSTLALGFFRVGFAFALAAGVHSVKIYYAYPLSWVVGCIVSGLYYASGRWKQKIYADVITGEIPDQALARESSRTVN